MRQDSWEEFAYPQWAAKQFQQNGLMIALASIFGFALIFAAARWLGQAGSEGFYAVMSHNLMVAIFAPAFLFPLFSIGVSLRRYWRATDGMRVQIGDVGKALHAAANMRDLSGGHGDGCNFEDEDRFTQACRMAHQLVLYGFLLCFASTSSGTILHYVFDMHAPYGFWSLPKLLGIPGGIMLTLGGVWLLSLKFKADPELGAQDAWGGEVAFILLLGFVGFSGLVLYWGGATAFMPTLLALHLGAVLSFFLLMPYTKMFHGFYRLAALVRDAQRKRQ